MGLVTSSSFPGDELEDDPTEGEPMPEYLSKERVERNNVLLYIEGDPIDPEDEQTLREQGYLAEPKKKKATPDKARKATKNK